MKKPQNVIIALGALIVIGMIWADALSQIEYLNERAASISEQRKALPNPYLQENENSEQMRLSRDLLSEAFSIERRISNAETEAVYKSLSTVVLAFALLCLIKWREVVIAFLQKLPSDVSFLAVNRPGQMLCFAGFAACSYATIFAEAEGLSLIALALAVCGLGLKYLQMKKDGKF